MSQPDANTNNQPQQCSSESFQLGCSVVKPRTKNTVKGNAPIPAQNQQNENREDREKEQRTGNQDNKDAEIN